MYSLRTGRSAGGAESKPELQLSGPNCPVYTVLTCPDPHPKTDKSPHNPLPVR